MVWLRAAVGHGRKPGQQGQAVLRCARKERRVARPTVRQKGRKGRKGWKGGGWEEGQGASRRTGDQVALSNEGVAMTAPGKGGGCRFESSGLPVVYRIALVLSSGSGQSKRSSVASLRQAERTGQADKG